MSEDKAHVIFVGKIPKDTKDEDFQSLFPGSYRSFMVKSSFSKKFRVGYVYYSSSELAEKALSSGAQLPNGSSLTLKPAADKVSSLSNKKEALKRVSQTEFDRKVAKEKQARIIIRNLSFKASEDDIKKAFSPHGAIKQINILKKPDGKLVGCAFLQYENVQQASKAIKSMNGTNLMGRTVALDWAVAKKKFQSHGSAGKPENAQEEEEEEDNNDEESEDDAMSIDEEESEGEDQSEEENENDEDDGGSSMDEDDSSFEDEEEDSSRPKWEPGHDINEGRTVFIRNLSFDSMEEDLMDLMKERYGKVVFARFVMDKIKEHPKGTAFVKFEQTKSAERAVNDKEPLVLDDRTLNVVMAIKKSDADSMVQKKQNEKKLGKDKRNLHLAREGLIREGTRAAADVSKTDLALRTKIQKWKTNMLKDLSSFVSTTRLCIRNIPEDFNDKKLRNLFKKHGALTEAKVIRDVKINPAKGSAELGFVTFKEHEMALRALRAINNNPSTFRKDRRPIVEFSIENIKAIKAREKRLQKSRDNNPNFKPKQNKTEAKQGSTRQESPEELPSYVGSRNDPKQKNLPSHIGAKIRTARPKISRKDLKKGAKRKALEKKIRVVPPEPKSKKEKAPEDPPKEKKKNKRKMKPETLKELKEEKSFNSMVQSYKAKLLDSYEPAVKKKKWFSE